MSKTLRNSSNNNKVPKSAQPEVANEQKKNFQISSKN